MSNELETEIDNILPEGLPEEVSQDVMDCLTNFNNSVLRGDAFVASFKDSKGEITTFYKASPLELVVTAGDILTRIASKGEENRLEVLSKFLDTIYSCAKQQWEAEED